MSDCLPTLKEDSDDDANFCVEITKEEFAWKSQKMKAKK